VKTLEGQLLAAKSKSTAPTRISFAKIREPQEVPNLLALQTESFDWLLGNDAWRARLGKNERPDRGEIPKTSGLEEIFEEISPIEDFQGSMSLSFRDHRFEPPKYSIAECKERDITYAAPLFVTAEFTNNVTGEIKSQTVFMGDFPLMTPRGTFVINGTERVVVSQLVRSPGVYFERTVEKTADKDIYTAKIIPSRGAWLEFEIDKKDFVAVRIDRKRKQSVTVFLKALGWTNDQILAEFGEYDSMKETLAKDNVNTQDEALLDIYRKMRPGEPPTKEAAQTLIENLYFNPKRYDLAKVGRFKVNKKLGLDLDLGKSLLAIDDIVGTIRYIVALHKGEALIDLGKQVRVEIDDIDHFGNRRLRTVGELIQNQVRVGLSRMERVVRERMTTQDVEAITPQTLINIRPITAAIKEFFGTSQLSQFMDQTNPISGLTHKRRLSALGPGGLSRDRAGFEVRDVHPSHYGRMCPIETPEGPNIGLIGSLATYARITPFGFVETPYRKVVKGKVTDQVDYLTADEEDEHIIAQANAPLTDDNHFAEARVLVRRRGGEVEYIPAEEVDYMDVSPRQMVSVATAMIPFLEHDDANRALMGANMMRQAVPLLRAESPLVGTGMEYRAAVDAGDVLLAVRGGVVTEVASDIVVVKTDDGDEDTYNVDKFIRSNQGTSRNMRVIVNEGDKIAAGQAIADGPSTQLGEMALGKNLLVAFMSWEGHNYEDAIILSQRLVQDDVLSSIHIEEYEVDARDTKLGAEEITRDIPNVSEEVLADLDERGIIRIGADVVPGDILVGKVTPKGETELTPEERLLRAIFGEKAREVRDTSLKVPHGEGGKVIGVKIFDLEDGYDLPAGVNQVVRVYVAQKRKIQDGDKLAGRHGNKGVIAKILPVEDMPFLTDGTPVDVVLNPLGVPGRMNVGQVLETHLGWVAKSGWEVNGSSEGWQQRLDVIGASSAAPGTRVATPVFDGAREEEIQGLLGSTLPNADGDRLVGANGKATLFDGRTGQPYREQITVGYMYILKLHHLVDDKIHARSTGPYSMITQQPLGGKAQFGGQRFGEMEVWALEAYGAAYTLQELLTIKSDDVLGRVKVYEAIVKGENIPEPGIPESFKVLVKEMQSLCLNVEVLSSEGVAIEMRDTDEEVFKTAEELGINLSRVEPSSVEEV
jgi:DNA-directed RNA polymerase subunit beta